MSLEECKCRCHESGFNIKHIAPCCYKCQHCSKRIKGSFIVEHKEECIKDLNPNAAED